MKKEIKSLVLSDIHLGNTRNKTHDIIYNLENFMVSYTEYLKDLDIIFISGDLFDRLLTTKSLEYKEILSYMSRLFMFCKEHNIKLRVLEGTPSHDYKQLQPFVSVIQHVTEGVDFKYFDYLTIEHIEDLGIDILYVPDEWNIDALDTYEEVKILLKEHKLDKVDLCIMHGCFKYQHHKLKDMKFTHNEESYLDITRYYILIGHIHTHSVYDRIIAPGSFDRLTHGEEENKGGVWFKIESNGNMEYKFLPNTLATLFLTVDYTSYTDLELLVKAARAYLKNVISNSHVRVLLSEPTMVNGLSKILTREYPNITFTFKSEKAHKVETEEEISLDVLEINKDNIVTLIEDELKNIPNVSEEQIKRIMKIVVELKTV